MERNTYYPLFFNEKQCFPPYPVLKMFFNAMFSSQTRYASLSKCWPRVGSQNITLMPFLLERFGLKRPLLLETILSLSQNSIKSIELIVWVSLRTAALTLTGLSPSSFWLAWSLVAGLLDEVLHASSGDPQS